MPAMAPVLSLDLGSLVLLLLVSSIFGLLGVSLGAGGEFCGSGPNVSGPVSRFLPMTLKSLLFAPRLSVSFPDLRLNQQGFSEVKLMVTV